MQLGPYSRVRNWKANGDGLVHFTICTIGTNIEFTLINEHTLQPKVPNELKNSLHQSS